MRKGVGRRRRSVCHMKGKVAVCCGKADASLKWMSLPGLASIRLQPMGLSVAPCVQRSTGVDEQRARRVRDVLVRRGRRSEQPGVAEREIGGRRSSREGEPCGTGVEVADRFVTHSGKSERHATTRLCRPGISWSPRSRDDAIRVMERGECSHCVEVARRWVDVHVHVVRMNGHRCMRTDPDGNGRNSLETLPDC